MMKRFSNLIITLSFVLFILALHPACGRNKSSVPVKEWEVLYGRYGSIETVSQGKNWEALPDLKSIRSRQSTGSESHSIWLRGNFFINGNPDGYYGLSTGSVRFADKTYINNVLVGSRSLEQVNWNPKPRNYRIQENILKRGRNEIYIELGIYGDEPGGISEEVLVQAKDDFNRSDFLTNLTYNQFPFAILFLHICLSIQFFIFFLWERREKHFLYTSLSLLIAAVYVAMFLPMYRQMSFSLSHLIKFTCVIIISIFIMLNYQSLYRIYLTVYNRIIIPVLLALVLLIFVLGCKIYSPVPVNLLLGLNFVIIASAFSYLIYKLNYIHRINQKKPDKFLRTMTVAALGIFSLIIILESYSFITGGFHPGFISIFVPPVLILFYQTIVSRESQKRRMELEILYSRLKKSNAYSDRIETEMSHAGASPLTDNSERKIKKIIEFIDENYISDLSREGLAAAVDMHPNYMGKLFKTYTRKTINEYINSLRIKEAIKQLESKNSRVIDIAFSLGFDNIVTFNRVFKKETGKTPSDYKKSE